MGRGTGRSRGGGGDALLPVLSGLRQVGLSVRVFEAGGGIGGTWYWNRYPEARFDSESYSYGYSFSEELLQCAPLLNRPINAETQRRIKASYPEICARCRESHGCFIHQADSRKALEVSAEEREAFYA